MAGTQKRAAQAAKAALAASGAWWYADSRGWVRPWRTNTHTVSVSANERFRMDIRNKAAPPPIGALEWPAGRVLLQWALDGGIPRTGCSVLEIGSGVGTTCIGLTLACNNNNTNNHDDDVADGAKAHETGRQQHTSSMAPTRVIATDICNASLDNLRHNARSNRVHVHPDDETAVTHTSSSNTTVHVHTQKNAPSCSTMEVYNWNAGSASAVKTLPVDIRTLTHVIAADVVYSGGASSMSKKSRKPPSGDSSSPYTDAPGMKTDDKPVMTTMTHNLTVSESDNGVNRTMRVASSSQHTTATSSRDTSTHTATAVESSSESESNGCLAATLADMLAVNPRLDITLLLIDRFSGPAVAAVAQV